MMQVTLKKTTVFTTAMFLFVSVCSNAQDKKIKSDKNKDKVTIESIQPVCPDLAQNKKPRLTVANFKLTAPNAPRDQYGDNLATMLTNALQNVQCYRVLERLANMDDINKEIEFQGSGSVDKKTAVSKGKMLGANVIVQGEITEFEQSKASTGVTLIKTSSAHAKIGLIIRMIDPQTREVIATKSFNVEKKVSSGFKIGVYVPYLGDINAMSTALQNPAVQDATEDCIIQAVQYIASQKDKINMPENDAPEGASSYTVTIQNIQYNQLSKISSALEKIAGVSSVNSDDYSSNTANIVVVQTIKLKELVDKLLALNTGVSLSVTGMNKDGATLVAK
jgi:curli biogenesis system outer membrane secretion channel CsgG